jgi:hypothetical protein
VPFKEEEEQKKKKKREEEREEKKKNKDEEEEEFPQIGINDAGIPRQDIRLYIKCHTYFSATNEQFNASACISNCCF